MIRLATTCKPHLLTFQGAVALSLLGAAGVSHVSDENKHNTINGGTLDGRFSRRSRNNDLTTGCEGVTMDTILDRDKNYDSNNNTSSPHSPSSKLFLPTLQAATRAARLVQATTLMALDYQMAIFDQYIRKKKQQQQQEYNNNIIFYFSTKFNNVGNASRIANDDNNINGNNKEHDRDYWHQMVKDKSLELERAQAEYTVSTNALKNRNKDNSRKSSSLQNKVCFKNDCNRVFVFVLSPFQPLLVHYTSIYSRVP